MTVYPHSTYFLTLSPHALIMNPTIDIKTQITEKKTLESLMMRDKPVVPPDSVIRTFSHLRGDKIDLILTQDGEGLCQGSFILRRGEWAKFFLDTWFDPLYRSYNFQKAEGHALVSYPQSRKSQQWAHKRSIGACCSMAPYNLDEARTYSTESYQCIRFGHPFSRWKRIHVQRRRLHSQAGWVRTGRG